MTLGNLPKVNQLKSVRASLWAQPSGSRAPAGHIQSPPGCSAGQALQALILLPSVSQPWIPNTQHSKHSQTTSLGVGGAHKSWGRAQLGLPPRTPQGRWEEPDEKPCPFSPHTHGRRGEGQEALSSGGAPTLQQPNSYVTFP